MGYDLIEETKKKRLGIISVIGITYFNVLGGPFGTEDIISGAGPIIGILGIALFPFIWGFQMSLITAELSTAIPTNIGYSIWIDQAFGAFFRFQIGYWVIFSTIIGTSLFPALAFETMFASSINEFSFIGSYLIKLIFSVVFTLPNLFALNIVGKGLFISTFVILSPFLALMIIDLLSHKCDWSIIVTDGKTFSLSGLTSLVSIIYWNMSGMDCIATFSAEVENPKKVLPIALVIATLLVSISMIGPLAVATAVNDPPFQTWVSGSWSIIAEKQGGFAVFFCFQGVSILSNLCQYISTQLQCTWQLKGMGENNLAPVILAKANRFGAPYVSITLTFLCICILNAFNFTSLLAVNNFFSCCKSLMLCAAWYKLRISHQHITRPYKIPLGLISGLILIVLPCFLTGGTVLFLMCMQSFSTLVMNISFLLLGLVAAIIFHFMDKTKGGSVNEDLNISYILQSDVIIDTNQPEHTPN